MSDATGSGLSGDELAGVVQLFGGLTPDELTTACVELTYRERGERPDPDTIEEEIEDAREALYLVPTEREDDVYLLAGPTAFPTLPPFAEDLHHLLDVPDREFGRTAPARSLIARLGEELEGGVSAARREEIAQLSYDIEAWAEVDASDLRERT